MSLLDLLLNPLARYERTPDDRERDRAVSRLSREHRRAPRVLTPMEHEVRRLRTLISSAEVDGLRAHYQGRVAS